MWPNTSRWKTARRLSRVRGAAAVLVTCLALVTAACAGRGSAPAAASAPPTAATPAAVPAAARPDHVVVVVLENKDERDVARESPYLSSLAARGVSFTDMHAETHPSQPNYLALFSGDTQGVVDDSCPQSFSGPSLGGELVGAGLTFAGYAEALPRPGFVGCTAGDYARKHAPWTAFRDVGAAASQPLTAMPTDYARLPTVSFVVPDLCHDMHNCSIAEGDRWLAQNVDGYARWAATHESLLVVTFDESEDDGDQDNHIATLAVGQRVIPGPVTARTDHYRLLRTIEDLYGLAPLGRTAEARSIPQLWSTAG